MIFDFLFGCTHQHTTFPLTPKRGWSFTPAARRTGTYIVCIDCGKEFPYDWKQMKVVKEQRKSKLITLFMER